MIIIEYIYNNEIMILFFIIFKDENYFINWLLINILFAWKYNYNSKNWINNNHEFKWLKKYFEFIIQDKINK